MSSPILPTRGPRAHPANLCPRASGAARPADFASVMAADRRGSHRCEQRYAAGRGPRADRGSRQGQRPAARVGHGTALQRRRRTERARRSSSSTGRAGLIRTLTVAEALEIAAGKPAGVERHVGIIRRIAPAARRSPSRAWPRVSTRAPIISALMAVEQQPITHLTHQQEKLAASQHQLQTLQSSLQQLAFSVVRIRPALAVRKLPDGHLERTAAGQRGHDQRRRSRGLRGRSHPAGELGPAHLHVREPRPPKTRSRSTGGEYKLAAGASAKELASKINSDGSATVYAAVLDTETIVLSNRTTGATGGEFIAVADPGGTLTEKAGTAKEGKNAEYKVDGVAGTASSNTVTTRSPASP